MILQIENLLKIDPLILISSLNRERNHCIGRWIKKLANIGITYHPCGAFLITVKIIHTVPITTATAIAYTLWTKKRSPLHNLEFIIAF